MCNFWLCWAVSQPDSVPVSIHNLLGLNSRSRTYVFHGIWREITGSSPTLVFQVQAHVAGHIHLAALTQNQPFRPLCYWAIMPRNPPGWANSVSYWFFLLSPEKQGATKTGLANIFCMCMFYLLSTRQVQNHKKKRHPQSPSSRTHKKNPFLTNCSSSNKIVLTLFFNPTFPVYNILKSKKKTIHLGHLLVGVWRNQYFCL